MSWKEIIICGLFIGAIIFILLDFMARQDFPTYLKLTADEQSYVFKELKRKSAGDCVLERTDYGWSCVEISSGKVFKVYAKMYREGK